MKKTKMDPMLVLAIIVGLGVLISSYSRSESNALSAAVIKVQPELNLSSAN